MEKLSDCPICHSENIKFILRTGDFSALKDEIFVFSECRDCKIIFLSERPEKEEADKYYHQDYQPYAARYNYLTELFIKWRTLREIDVFKKLNKNIKEVLEVGCSFGKYLKDLRDWGNFNVVGVEISQNMAQKGQEEFNLEIKAGELLEYDFGSNRFDLIIMSHVIEHLYNSQETLKEIFKILNPQGLFLIKTPNFETIERKIFNKYWIVYEAPRHVIIFSERTLSKLLEKSGFKILKVHYEKTPNNIILSIRNLLIAKNFSRTIVNFFNLNNYLLLFLFSPVSFILGLFKISGRIVVIAQKP